MASSKAVAALATRVRGLRMIACASQVIAWVARNQMQAYVSWDLNAWDVCAGMLIVQQSGGTVLDMQTGRNATLASRGSDPIFTSLPIFSHLKTMCWLAIIAKHPVRALSCFQRFFSNLASYTYSCRATGNENDSSVATESI